jgi:hypothetical protein
MLIKAYGTFWNPDIVEWGRKGHGKGGKLIGCVKKDKTPKEIDFWKSRGIYVLHADFKTVYVGKSFKTCIGKRLRDHLTDRFAWRWDMFSWYGISNPRFTEKDVSEPGERFIGPNEIVDGLEALAILIADPALNRKRESLSTAYYAEQPKDAKPRTIRSYLEELLARARGANLGRSGSAHLVESSGPHDAIRAASYFQVHRRHHVQPTR